MYAQLPSLLPQAQTFCEVHAMLAEANMRE